MTIRDPLSRSLYYACRKSGNVKLYPLKPTYLGAREHLGKLKTVLPDRCELKREAIVFPTKNKALRPHPGVGGGGRVGGGGGRERGTPI